ncbi:MAG: hypothetical protein IPJ39_03020 [Saprospiraceae bacterium]|nr:hypothetical protein [Saprospiraceae bacterium]
MKAVLVLSFMFVGVSIFAQQATLDTLKVNNLDQVTIVGDRAKSIPGSGQYISIRKLEKLNHPNVNNILRVIPVSILEMKKVLD